VGIPRDKCSSCAITDLMNDVQRHRRPAIWLGAGFPLLVTVVAVGLQLSWWGDLPDPIAVHWTGNTVDGFGSKVMVPWATAILALVFPLIMTVAVLAALDRGSRGPNLRFMISVAASFAVIMATLLTGSLYIQRGLVDAADAGSIGPVVLASVVGGVVAGVIAWFLQPRQETVVGGEQATPLEMSPSERAVWASEIGMTPALIIVVGLGTLMSAVAAVMIWINGDRVVAIPLTVTAVVIAVLVFGYSRARVMVDERGLTVKPVIGWPRFHVPVEEIEAVETRDVSGLAEFGGYGFRWIPGAFGVILNRGEAISVTRSNGRRFVVTVDDAATGAGLLQAYAQRRG